MDNFSSSALGPFFVIFSEKIGKKKTERLFENLKYKNVLEFLNSLNKVFRPYWTENSLQRLIIKIPIICKLFLYNRFGQIRMPQKFFFEYKIGKGRPVPNLLLSCYWELAVRDSAFPERWGSSSSEIFEELF